MIASNELCLAQKFVNDYTVDPILPEHFETEACDRFLTAGITAHKWLCRAEESLHAAVEHGIMPPDPTLDEAVEGLYRRWLAACERAESWIEANLDDRARPGQLSELRACCDAVRARLEDRSWLKQSSKAVKEGFASEPW